MLFRSVIYNNGSAGGFNCGSITTFDNTINAGTGNLVSVCDFV